MHPKVRTLVLVLLSQILRRHGSVIDANLSPVTDMCRMVEALSELLSQGIRPSRGRVIEFDLNTVTVDLASVPLDEVLDFRRQNLELHKRYMLSVRSFAMALSRMPEEERRVKFELRQSKLDDLASDLRNCARTSWKKPASVALSLAGTVASAMDPLLGSLMMSVGTLAGLRRSGDVDTGAYTYLFRAHRQFRRYY